MTALGRICNQPPLNRTVGHSWESFTRYGFRLELSRLFFRDGCHAMAALPAWRDGVDFRRRREYAGAVLRWAKHDPEMVYHRQTRRMSRPGVTVNSA
jgi:hypothetical protein